MANYRKRYVHPPLQPELPCPCCGEDLMGDGILDDLKKTFNSTTKGINKGVENVKQAINNPMATAKSVINTVAPTRLDFPPKVRDVIAANKDKAIDSITVGRNPVRAAVTALMNALSLDQLKSQVKREGYDNLYHLFMLVSLTDGSTILVEKNQVVNMEKVSSKNYPTESRIDVPLTLLNTKRLKFGDFINNAVKAIGSPLYLYDAISNNCQVFVCNMLNSSGLLTPEITDFSMQDVEKVLSTSPSYLQKLTKFATDAAAKVDRLKNGGHLKKGKIILYPETTSQRYPALGAASGQQHPKKLLIKNGKAIMQHGGMVGYLPGQKPDLVSSDMATAKQQMADQAQADLLQSPFYDGPQYSYDYTNVPRLYNPYGISTESNSDGSYIVPHIDEDILDLDKQTIDQISAKWGPKFADHIANNLADQIKHSMQLTTTYGNSMDQTNKTRNEMINTLQGQLNGFNIFKQIFVGGVKAIAEAMMHF